MKDLLQQPVYNALLTNDSHFNIGIDKVKYFDAEVSPFVDFEAGYKNGFRDLHDLLPADRKILFASPTEIAQPNGWEILKTIKGLQFVFEKGKGIENNFPNIIPLHKINVDEMVSLAKLTVPGPFNKRTIEFGSYFGIFAEDKLVSMTGQRLHINNFSEISAVCTHPEHTGKGYAFQLLQHQINIILKESKVPFLHVWEENRRAIEIYQRLGFKVSRRMNFYFMGKQKAKR